MFDKLEGFMKECQNCGHEFKPERFHPYQRTCSLRCRMQLRNRKRYNLGPVKNKLICEVCDREFTQYHSNNTSYCNFKCKRLGVRRKFKGMPVKGPKRTKPWGSGYISSSGYKIISKNHPNAQRRSKNGKGQISEHIWVMSEYLKRPLLKHERVHHINGIRDDNRLENLELWSHSHPPGQRVEDKIKWCIEFLHQYGYKIEK